MLQCTFCSRRISHITPQEISHGWGITKIKRITSRRPITLIHCPDHGPEYIRRIFALAPLPSPQPGLSVLQETPYA